MKLVVIPVAVASLGLMMFPVLFASGDGPGGGCTGNAQIDVVLATIRTVESSGDYTVRSAGSTASGAYQFLDSTWAGFGGYPRAWEAPPDVQDARAAADVSGILEANHGDVNAVPMSWYIGHVPPVDSAEWDTVPYPDAGNVLTPRQYVERWLAEYAKHATPDGAAMSVCTPGGAIAPNADGYAIPGPPELFGVAAVNEPHHDYPAWDWLLPEGTPIYAIRGGRVTTVQYWPFNWWDRGCGVDATGCKLCGIGVTIEDDEGTHWAYCHGVAVHVNEGDTITAGTQILSSGNTGSSGAPHVHIQIITSDGVLRCPQPLLRALRMRVSFERSGTLATHGCSY
jgi:hypothetical protein